MKASVVEEVNTYQRTLAVPRRLDQGPASSEALDTQHTLVEDRTNTVNKVHVHTCVCK